MAADRVVLVRVKAMVTDFTAGMARAGMSVKAMGAEIDKASKEHPEKLAKVSRAALAVGGGVALGFGLAEKAVIGFDKQMSAVGAASQANAKQFGILRDAAIQAGRDTAFSATDAATAEEELAKAGVSVADITGGALAGALSLASAGQLDLGDAATYAASAMTQFGLSGKDVPHIADVLAAAAGKAQGDVSDMGFALSQSGLVAHQMGLTLDQTAGTLAEFASNGLLGSDAGTSFKQMLLSLTPQSEQAAAMMKQLGLNFFDAQGKFVGISQVAGQLHDKLGDLSQEQQTVALKTIFGTDAIRAATIVMKDGATGSKKWTDAVNDQGFAADVAAKKMDNLAGDLEQLRGSIETALIKGGSSATGALRFMAQEATGAVNAFSDLPTPLQASGVALSGVSGGALLALGGVGALVPKVREARTALSEMGTAGEKANLLLGTLGKASVVGAGVLGLVVAVAKLGDAIDNTGRKAAPTVDGLSASLKRLAASGDLKGAGLDAQHLAGAIQSVNEGATTAGGTISAYAGQVSNLIHGNLGATVSFHNYRLAAKDSKDEIGNLDAALAQMVSGGDVDAAKGAFDDLSTGLRAQGLTTKDITKAFPQYGAALKGAKADADLASAGIKGTSTSIDGLKDSAQSAADQVKDLKDKLDLLNGVNIGVTQAAIQFKDSVANLGQSFKDNGRSMDLNTVAGRANLDTFLNAAQSAESYAEAIVNQTGDQASANKVLNDARTALYNTMIQSGLTRAQARALVDQYLKVPKNVNTAFHANTGPANSALAALQRRIAAVRGKTITFNVQTIYSNPGDAIRVPGGTRIGKADGGLVHGPGGPREDRVPAMLSAGEFVLAADTVARVGVGYLNALNGGTVKPAVPVGAMVRPVSAAAGGGIDYDRLAAAVVRAAPQQENPTRVEVTGRLVGKGKDLLAVLDDASLDRGRLGRRT